MLTNVCFHQTLHTAGSLRSTVHDEGLSENRGNDFTLVLRDERPPCGGFCPDQVRWESESPIAKPADTTMSDEDTLQKHHDESESEESDDGVEDVPKVDVDPSTLTPLSPEVISKQVCPFPSSSQKSVG